MLSGAITGLSVDSLLRGSAGCFSRARDSTSTCAKRRGPAIRPPPVGFSWSITPGGAIDIDFAGPVDQVTEYYTCAFLVGLAPNMATRDSVRRNCIDGAFVATETLGTVVYRLPGGRAIDWVVRSDRARYRTAQVLGGGVPDLIGPGRQAAESWRRTRDLAFSPFSRASFVNTTWVLPVFDVISVPSVLENGIWAKRPL